MHSSSKVQGFALITVIFMLAVTVSLVAAYVSLTQIELANVRYSRDSTRSFYAAEAGLNLRAEEIRQRFVGYNRPDGSSPSASAACIGGNVGAGDFACKDYQLGSREAFTYVVEEPGNPIILTIPPGERYQYLNAQEYRYTATSIAVGPDNRDGARLELRFKSRLVPLFQFAAFYNKDLEILPGPTMNLSGPVHTNGDLYLNSSSAVLTINGQVISAGSLFRGRKNDATCRSNSVRVYNPLNPTHLVPSCSGRVLVPSANLTPWNSMIQSNVEPVTVPEPEDFDPVAGKMYWDHADLRLVLALTGTGAVDTANSATGVEIRNVDDSVDVARTNLLNACAGAIGGRPANNTNTFYNNREGMTIRMLDIDLLALLNCAHTQSLLEAGRQLDDDTQGGLVVFATVKGPHSSIASNNYGFRVRNAARIYSNVGGAPAVQGLSLISDQAAYIYGNFNSSVGNWVPAAVMADSLNILSNNFNDAFSAQSLTGGNRNATATTVNAAFLSGTDTTGNIEGSGGQNGAYNGGLENYPRFHERWNGVTLTYRGSFVSLNRPRHVDGLWVYGAPQYEAPNRDWNYDSRFNDAANLPPITPRFVYLRQELFVRDYGMNG